MSTICLVTALSSEARPLVAHLDLHRVDGSGLDGPGLGRLGLQLWENEQICLLQCGIGKLSAAAGMGAMLALYPRTTGIVNVGICGAERDIGDVLLAHCVLDESSGRRWYPHLPPQKRLPDIGHTELHTLDKPGIHYQSGVAFDMEAAGIASAASRHLDFASVQFIKVVSDNCESSLHSIGAAGAEELVCTALPAVEKMISCIQAQSHNTDDHDSSLAGALMDSCHHTVTERHALRRLLQRCHALQGDIPPAKQLLALPSATAIRDTLLQCIANAGIRY